MTPPISSQTGEAFDFGSNWEAFSNAALNEDRVEEARVALRNLFAEGDLDVRGKSFLDIGFGQGLSLMLAQEMGARVAGCDINPLCRKVLEQNRKRFFQDVPIPPVWVGSILDAKAELEIRQLNEGALFEVVHSWGVLHHTGHLDKALENAAGLVRPDGGFLVLALYAYHWTSPAWLQIKRHYNRCGKFGKRAWVWLLWPVIFMAKFLVTGRWPLRQQRGMDFYHDVVDWVGGYPYEPIARDELIMRMQELGFSRVADIPPITPTGCHEYIFKKDGGGTKSNEPKGQAEPGG